MNSRLEIKRHLGFIRRLIESLELSMQGLTVLTECASGAYAYTAAAALLAGAKVVAFGKDTRHGTFSDNKANLEHIISSYDKTLLRNLTITNKQQEINFSEIDILTNSGLMRPITSDVIGALKPTSVIPLMWETWEFRDSDLDIKACQQRNIPVIGTNEYFPPTDLSLTAALLGVKVLFDINVPVGNCNIVLIGGKIPAVHIAGLYERMGIPFTWYTPTGTERKENCYPYSQLKNIYRQKYINAIVCAEHNDPFLIAGQEGGISFAQLAKTHPTLWWAHLFGNIDADELVASGLSYYPAAIRPFGYQTYGTEHLGYEPVIQLNVCGLKVGELAAKARLGGKSIEETIKITLNHGIGQDFEGGFLHFKPRTS